MKSWNHPGGETPELGGAVIVHVFPVQENAGKIVLAPIVLPCVLEVAEIPFMNRRKLKNNKTCSPDIKDTLMVDVVPWKRLTVIEY